MGNERPFAGLKVVDLSTWLAAPTAARLLADWGADVIKVEGPGGDAWRSYGANFFTPTTDEENPVYDIPNANKKNVVIDLKSPKGMEILHKMLAEADVFITNNRLSPLRKMGLDYDTLKEKFPRLIYGIITGYGETGPDEAKPGFDTVAYWAAGGFIADMRIDGPGSYPIYTPAGVADLMCGTILFGGISAALLNREKTGKGDKLSVSLFGTAVWSMGVMNTITQEPYNYIYPKTRFSGNPMAISYPCSDGEWMMISALEFDRYFPVLCKAMGIEHLLSDPKYKDKPTMMENAKEFVGILEERFATKTSEEWDAILVEADIVHNRLTHFKEVHKSEQARINHYVEEITFRSGRKAWLPRPSLQSDNLGLPPYNTAPPRGTDTKDVVKALGYSDAEVASMIEQKILIGR